MKLFPQYYSNILFTEINLFCIAVIWLTISLLKRNIQTTAQNSFKRAAYASMASVVFDMIWKLMHFGAIPTNWFIFMLMKSFYFMTTTGMCWHWYMYFEDKRLTKVSSDIKYRRWSGILVYLQIVLTVINAFTGIFFRTDPVTMAYSHGPLYILQYVFAYTYPAVAVIRAIKEASSETIYVDKDYINTLIVLPIFPAVAGIIQLIDSSIPALCCALALVITMVYMTSMTNAVSQDPLTGLNNRRQLTKRLISAFQAKDQNFFLIMVDIDRFKEINDKYGHAEGDKAIMLVSDALLHGATMGKKRYMVSRYGGDEFAVCGSASSLEEVELLQRSLTDHLNQSVSEADTEYTIGISLGYAFYQKEMVNVQELIEAADERMYKIKEEHHAETK